MRYHLLYVSRALVLFALSSLLVVAASGCGVINKIGSANTNYFPPNLPRVTPTVTTFQGCPPQGQGGDPALNTLENRADDNPAGGWRDTDITQVMTVPTTPQVEGKDRSAWASAAAQRIALYEGSAVRTTGWVIAVRKGGPTAANCGSDVNRDWYLWIATGGGDAVQTAMVVVITPRVRALRPGWTDYTMRRLVGQVVRVEGYLLYDQEPPAFVVNDRATAWEIQPVMHMETLYLNNWINLDLVPFGSRESGTPQASPAGTVTPIIPITPTAG
ncbi:MAG TPA: hypothetical protein VF725_11060 [Ktedonobacterales bacterium]